MTKRRHDWQRWLGRGAWAVADQGLFALASALLNILLARWLVPGEYGVFAVAYSVFLFIGAGHTALLTEPMLVFGSDRYARLLPGYIRVLLRGHWLLTGAGSVFLFMVGALGWLRGDALVAQAAFGLALAAPFTLLLWLMRRAAYARLQPQLATAASALYLLLIMAGLAGLNFARQISVLTVLLWMGLASAIAGVWLVWRVCMASELILGTAQRPAERAVLSSHWTYGRWALATNMLIWVPLNFYFVVLSAQVSLEASATLKALTNLALPLLQANAALSALLLPPLVMRARNLPAFRRLVRSALLLFCAGATLYALVHILFGKPLVHLLYGGKYDEAASLLWLLAMLPLLDGAAAVFAGALRSLEHPQLVFWANLSAAACVLTAGVWATGKWGLTGAASGMLLSDLVAVGLLGGFVWRSLRSARSVEQPRAAGEPCAAAMLAKS